MPNLIDKIGKLEVETTDQNEDQEDEKSMYNGKIVEENPYENEFERPE